MGQRSRRHKKWLFRYSSFIYKGYFCRDRRAARRCSSISIQGEHTCNGIPIIMFTLGLVCSTKKPRELRIVFCKWVGQFFNLNFDYVSCMDNGIFIDTPTETEMIFCSPCTFQITANILNVVNSDQRPGARCILSYCQDIHHVTMLWSADIVWHFRMMSLQIIYWNRLLKPFSRIVATCFKMHTTNNLPTTFMLE